MILTSEQLKAILKSASVELLHENRQEISDLLAEIIEDITMERAIGQGETTETVGCSLSTDRKFVSGRSPSSFEKAEQN